jgi:hypothetical protein
LALDELIAITGPNEAAFGGQGCEALVEGCGTHAATCAQLGEWQRAVEVGERRGDALIDRAWRRGLRRAPVDDFKREGIGALDEFERNGGHGGRGAVLDGEGEVAAGGPKASGFSGSGLLCGITLRIPSELPTGGADPLRMKVRSPDGAESEFYFHFRIGIIFSPPPAKRWGGCPCMEVQVR